MSNLYELVVNQFQVYEDKSKLKGNDFWVFIDGVANNNGKLAPSFIVMTAIDYARFCSRAL